MTDTKQTFTVLHADPEVRERIITDPYWAARDKILKLLLHYTLIESFKKFIKRQMPYPYVSPSMVRPKAATASREYTLHNTCLITLLDSPLPGNLKKHFRCREGNRVTRENIVDVAPDLPFLGNYCDSHRDSSHPAFVNLLRMLLPLDYSLLIQNTASPNDPMKKIELSNFHVRIERLTDNALRHLGIHLNYLERSLREKDDTFIETLEKKLYEYYHFYHNAGGRRAAAVHAAQLLFREKLPGTILVGSQQDRRLTLLTLHGKNQQTSVEQFFLIKLSSAAVSELIDLGTTHDIDIQKNFLISIDDEHEGLVVLKAEYAHTEAAKPTLEKKSRDGDQIHEDWLQLVRECIVPITPQETTQIGYSFAYRS
ncbi:MAG: hypothetical protein HQL86_03180 [Magnetococcales bacterium]|nr:hypothetical protein [Magnetococcales bacterium]